MCAIARAMMSQPKLLMLDEPSLGLSSQMVERVFELIRSLARAKGIAVLLVEQNVGDALGMANRGYVIERGRVVKSGSGAKPAPPTPTCSARIWRTETDQPADRHRHRRQPRHRRRDGAAARAREGIRRRQLSQCQGRSRRRGERHQGLGRRSLRDPGRCRQRRRRAAPVRRDRSRVRPAHRSRQQCRHHRRDQAAHRCADLRRDHGGDARQCHRAIAVRARGGETHVDPQRRQGRRHRECVVARRADRFAARLHRLRGLQGRARHHDDRARRRDGGLRHSRQCCAPRADRHGHPRRRRHSGPRQALRSHHADRPRRKCRKRSPRRSCGSCPTRRPT